MSEPNDPAAAALAAQLASQATEPKPPLPPLMLGTRLKALLSSALSSKALAPLVALVLGAGGGAWLNSGGKITAHPSPPLSTQQRFAPMTIDGCSYLLMTIGEATNANFAASLCHSGTCSNWVAHKTYMQ